jgi:hypothetical protein
MPQLTSPPQTERPVTPTNPPAPEGAFPPWLATAGGFTVLVAASLWIPALVTVVLGLVVLAVSAAVLYRAASAAGAGGGHGLAGLVTATLGLLLVGLLSLPGGLADEGGGLAFDPTPPAGATPAPPENPPPPSETTAPPSGGQPVRLRPAEVGASATARPSVDGAGQTVTFEAANLVDGRPDTAWRVDGDGVGQTLTFRFDRTVHLHAIGLLPGYAKVDPVSGTDRFPQNRRVTTATYHLDGSPPVAVRFTDAPDLQWIEVDAETTAVVVEITGTTDSAERDYTAVSEVQFTGWPAG